MVLLVSARREPWTQEDIQLYNYTAIPATQSVALGQGVVLVVGNKAFHQSANNQSLTSTMTPVRWPVDHTHNRKFDF